jgi:hypothetical protein
VAVSANGLATFADAKALFSYENTEQTAVEKLINFASAKIEVYTKRQLAARDSIFYLDGTGKDLIFLPEFPINSVASLYVDTLRAFGSDALIDADDYYIDAEAGTIQLYDDVFGSEGDVRVVKVTANVGYATTHLLYPVLNLACLEYVDWLKSRYASSGQIGKKGEYSADGLSVSWETDMPMHIKTALEGFVRRSV